MKKNATLFLQVVTVFVGVGLVFALLLEPRLEGRNVHATLFEIYFTDPFLACVYIGSLPFFVALFKFFRLLAYVRRGEVFMQHSRQAVRTVKRCALLTAAAIVAADVFIVATHHVNDDPVGAVVPGMVATFAAVVAAAVADVFEGILQKAADRTSDVK